MNEQYKRMEQRLESDIKKLKGEVESQESKIKSMKEEITGLNVKKE